MARTWTYHSTHSVTSGSVFAPASRALVNDARTEMYFVRNGSPQKVYKWDGASLTDLAGSNFPVTTSEKIWDICVFDSELFLGYGVDRFAGGPGTDMYRYTSGTSWTNEYTLTGEPANPDPGWIGQPFSGDDYPWAMDCDASYMAVAGNLSTISGETFRRMWTRDTAGNWSITQMPGSVYAAPDYRLVGLSKGSDYGTVFGINRLSSTDYRTIERGAPSPWTYLAGSNIGAKVPIGYGDGKSFFSHNTSGNTWELKYSTDWGVNLSAAGGLTFDEAHERAEWKFKNFPSEGIIMLATETHQAYTWDGATDEFVADGQTTDIDGNRAIFDFFVLGGVLYALTNSVTANSIEIWSAGPIGSAGFYYGRGGLQYRAALPFSYLNIGGLALPHPLAFIGNGASAPTMVGYFSPPDYDQFTDFTGALADDPIMNFDSTPYGNSQAAEGSGEDSGPGGSLSNGKC